MKLSTQNKVKQSGFNAVSGIRAGRGECLNCAIYGNNAYGWDCWEYTGTGPANGWQQMENKMCTGNPKCYDGNYGPYHQPGSNPSGDHCFP